MPTLGSPVLLSRLPLAACHRRRQRPMMIKCNSSWRRCCRLLLCVIWPRGASLSQNWANRRSRSDSATASLSLCGKMMMFFVFSFRNHSHFCAKGQTDCTFSLLLLLLLPVSHGQKPDKAIRYRLICDMLRGVHVRVSVFVCVWATSSFCLF